MRLPGLGSATGSPELRCSEEPREESINRCRLAAPGVRGTQQDHAGGVQGIRQGTAGVQDGRRRRLTNDQGLQEVPGPQHPQHHGNPGLGRDSKQQPGNNVRKNELA